MRAKGPPAPSCGNAPSTGGMKVTRHQMSHTLSRRVCGTFVRGTALGRRGDLGRRGFGRRAGLERRTDLLRGCAPAPLLGMASCLSKPRCPKRGLLDFGALMRPGWLGRSPQRGWYWATPTPEQLCRTPCPVGCAAHLFGEQRLGGAAIWDAVDSDGRLELGGGLICFGGCARAAPPGPRLSTGTASPAPRGIAWCLSRPRCRSAGCRIFGAPMRAGVVWEGLR